MKKFLGLAMVLILGFMSISCELNSTPSPRQQAIHDQQENASNAMASTHVPVLSYFQERRTIAKWVQRWDKPDIPTYVYLISSGTVLGYYVANGKPASINSFLVPEENIQTYGSYGSPIAVSAPDLDGTYGHNNEGIRFFTAEGTAVEWGGIGATYIYSDAPLPLNVPKLNVSTNKK